MKDAPNRNDLILRSRAERGVSKDGLPRDWFPPFETAAQAAFAAQRRNGDAASSG